MKRFHRKNRITDRLGTKSSPPSRYLRGASCTAGSEGDVEASEFESGKEGAGRMVQVMQRDKEGYAAIRDDSGGIGFVAP